jgi:predicted nucleic acid-binding protein
VPAYFTDTSALAKRYIIERGSGWVQSLLDPASGSVVFMVRVAAVELVAAITRRERSGSLPPADAASARSLFLRDLLAEYRVLEVTEPLGQRAIALVETHGLRGYDAVHLAAALEVNALLLAGGLPPLTLVSADAELNVAAAAEGLSVEDPNLHP